MKNRNIWHQLEEFAVGKGVYIVLALCIGAAGLTGYYLLDRALGPGEALSPSEPESLVTIPEPEPEVLLPSRPVQKPQTVTLPDPEPAESVAKPAVPETPAPRPMVFTWPVKGETLRGHSLETLSPDPTMGDWRTHRGVDISAKLGTRVLCMTRGTVAEVWEDEKLGTCVRVDHGDGLISTYSNLSPQPTVTVGQSLDTGDILGAVGSTAMVESAMAPHLHLEVFREGTPLDPLELLPNQ